ncbi:MAG: hypothetical protein CMF75_04480, partial [Maricaulis sp.]|nr:hypothetical protein [Maricaulis sp.]
MPNRNPRGVSIPDFNPRNIQTQGPLIFGGTPGSGDGAAQVASAFSRMSERLGRAADEAATREGRDAGAAAGLDPEFRRQEGNGAFERAYNAAGSAVYLQNLEVEVSGRVAEIGEQTRGDPEAMTAAFDGLRNELLQSQAMQDPAMRAAFEPMFARQRLGYQRQAFRDEIAAQSDAAAATADRWAQTRADAIVRLARTAGLDDVADAALTGEVDTLASQLVAYGPREGFEFRGEVYDADPDRAAAYSLQDIERILSRVESSAEEARVAGAYDRLPNDLAARDTFRQRFLGDWDDGQYAFIDEAGRARLNNAMNGDLSRRQTAAESARRDAVRALERALDRATDVTDAGLRPGDQVFETLAREALRLGDEELAQEALESGGIADAAEWAWQQNPVELRTEVDAARARLDAEGEASSFEARRLQAVETVLSRMETGLR